MTRRPSTVLLVAVAAAAVALPVTPAQAAKYTYKATWGGGLAQTFCDNLPPGECAHAADSSVPAAARPANFCVDAVARDGQETVLPGSGLGLDCRATLDASTFGVKERAGACVGAPRGISSNGVVTVESIYLPAPISVPVRVVNKNGVATVTGNVFVLGGTASVSAKFTATCATADPKKGVWSGTFTYDRAV